MTKLLILPDVSGWYYFSTHRGTKYHYFYKLSYHSFCGSVIFNDRKNDKVIQNNLLPYRTCQQCNAKLSLDKSVMYALQSQQLFLKPDKIKLQNTRRYITK